MAEVWGLLTQLRPHLDAGEDVLAVVQGSFESPVSGDQIPRPGILVATQNRMAFYPDGAGRADLESFAYQDVTDISRGMSILGHELSFQVHGRTARLSRISDGLAVEQFMTVASDRAAPGNPARPLDPAVPRAWPTQAADGPPPPAAAPPATPTPTQHSGPTHLTGTPARATTSGPHTMPPAPPTTPPATPAPTQHSGPTHLTGTPARATTSGPHAAPPRSAANRSPLDSSIDPDFPSADTRPRPTSSTSTSVGGPPGGAEQSGYTGNARGPEPSGPSGTPARDTSPASPPPTESGPSSRYGAADRPSVPALPPTGGSAPAPKVTAVHAPPPPSGDPSTSPFAAYPGTADPPDEDTRRLTIFRALDVIRDLHRLGVLNTEEWAAQRADLLARL